MAKDPAVLFYIDKWISATQGMRVEAKSWYLEMILYQFDKGALPDDVDEIASICRIRPSEFNVFEQVFEQVLKQKFNKNTEGMLENEFVNEILQKRKKFIEKRSNSGKLSYVLRYYRANHKMTKKFESFLKSNINLDFDIKNEQVLEQVFEQISELYINVNVNVNVNKDTIPDFEEFKNYALENEPNISIKDLELKYQAWKVNDWKTGKGNKIKNWKSTLLNTIPHIKKNNNNHPSNLQGERNYEQF